MVIWSEWGHMGQYRDDDHGEDAPHFIKVWDLLKRYVEVLDKYFGSVCELDIIFNFEKAYFVLDEYLLAGNLQESSKKKVCASLVLFENIIMVFKVLQAVEAADQMQEEDQEQEVTRSILEEFGLS